MKNDILAYTQDDSGFYPTPLDLADKMLSGIDYYIKDSLRKEMEK